MESIKGLKEWMRNGCWVEKYRKGWRNLEKKIKIKKVGALIHGFGKLAYICMGNDAQTMKNKKCDSADCKVAEKWKLQSKQSTTCPEGSRWTDSFSQLHQSASDKHPQGTDTPSENTSANWTVHWKWTESKEGSAQLSTTSRVITEITHLCLLSEICIQMLLCFLSFACELQIMFQLHLKKYHFTLQKPIQIIVVQSSATYSALW